MMEAGVIKWTFCSLSPWEVTLDTLVTRTLKIYNSISYPGYRQRKRGGELNYVTLNANIDYFNICDQNDLYGVGVGRIAHLEGSFRYPLAREGVWGPIGTAFLAHARQKFTYIVGLTYSFIAHAKDLLRYPLVKKGVYAPGWLVCLPNARERVCLIVCDLHQGL